MSRFQKRDTVTFFFDGQEGKSYEIRQNFRDYLMYNGDELIAIITLVKENGKIYGTPAFGAPWFKDFNETLQKHSGQKLLFVYAASLEVVILPDNSYFCPTGYEIGVEFGTDDRYQMLYHEKAIYVP